MSTEIGRHPLAAPRPHVPLVRRLYGFGSIYGKTLRDSRLAFIIMSGLLGGLVIVGGVGFSAAYATAESRLELATLVENLPPIMSVFYGHAVNIDTLGGSIAWKYGPSWALLAGLWSILALSGTLAVEASRGSLDFVAATPFGKRRIALEKLAAHLTILAGAMAILALASWVTGVVFGTLPGDEIPPVGAIGFALWVGLMALASGSVAFALAPVIGRGAAAAIAGAVMFAGYVTNGYSEVSSAFGAVADLNWFHWTADHIPLAGVYDWVSLVPVAIVAVVLLAIGVELFVRRDLGVTSTVRSPSLPNATLGLRGPVGRAYGDQLPLALAWGTGVGLYALVMAIASRSFSDELKKLAPDTLKLFQSIFPSFDIAAPGGFLQLVFVRSPQLLRTDCSAVRCR